MKKSTLIIWISSVLIIFIAILGIGLYYKKNADYIDAKSKLVKAAKEYLKKDDVIKPDDKITISLDSDTLIENKYFSDFKVKDKDCKGKVTINWRKWRYTFETEITCENK